MTRTFYMVALTLGLFGWNGNSRETVENSFVPKAAGQKVKLNKLEHLFMTGDLDGDNQMHKVFQHNYSS